MSSPAEVSSVSMGTRPYRCQKRQKPCDHCRERKLKCQTDGGPPPCQRCVRVNIPCTFVGRPRRRPASAAAAPPQPPESSHRHDESSSCEPLSDRVSSEQQQHAYHRSVSAGIVDGVTQPPDVTHSSHPMSGHFPDGANSEVAAGVVSGGPSLDYTDAGGPVGTCEPAAASVAVPTQALNTPTSSSFHNGGGRVSTQLSQTMDQIDGHSIMLLGASSESDPWLLRHCRFDQLGLRSVHKMYFRNAGGVPTKDKIPVHFIISDNKYLTHPMMMMQGDGGDVSVAFRAELNQLVPPSYGVRLICLFRKHVYPILPVVSSVHLDIAFGDAATIASALDAIPVHVLAAMYGLAMPFALNDELLAVVNAFEDPPLEQIWNMVYKLIQQELHKPNLSTLAAALLFLHKDCMELQGCGLSDSAFLWSFMGTTVGMAHTLGLHLECLMFGIPTQEKRLRRRLWWALYIEDKWRALFMGRPPYIRADEWDVSELQDADFELHSASYFDESVGRTFVPFRDMARLAVIVSDVQGTLYSLRACQKLAEDLPSSIQAAKTLFDQLNDWRASITPSEPLPTEDGAAEGGEGGGASSTYPATMYFAYLTAVAYVWRALLRPTVRSSPPPKIIDMEQSFHDAGFFFEELSWDFSELPEIELHLDEDVSEASATIKELHQAAQSYAGTLATFTSRLTSRHFGEFWYSWSRIGFAVVSNFLTLLLVQAPTAENVPRAKFMLENWRQTLRHQSKAFPILRLAMARLNSFYWGGLAETFCLPPHVQDILQQ